MSQKLKLTFLIVRLELPLGAFLTEKNKIGFQEEK